MQKCPIFVADVYQILPTEHTSAAFQTISFIDRILKGDSPNQVSDEDLLIKGNPSPLMEKSSRENRLAWNAIFHLLTSHNLLNPAGEFRSDLVWDCSLHCGTMFRSGYAGIRNAFRVGSDTVSEGYREFPSGFMDYIHPLTPLVNLPNLLGSEISMQLGLGSENSLFYSESSGAMALVDAFRNLNLLVSQLSLVVSAHAFGPHCLELYAANWEKLNQAENRWMPVEAGAALLMGTENRLLQAGLVPKLCLHKVEIIHKSADYNWSGCGNGLCVEPLLYLYSVLNSSESSGCVSIDHLDGAILNLEWERV